MPQPPQKDWFDIAIDFFFGAAFCNVVVTVVFFKVVRTMQNFSWHPLLMLLIASGAIGGSLAALYRDQFWSAYEKYSVIPPMEERVSKRAQILLWIVFGLGCASLGLLLVD